MILFYTQILWQLNILLGLKYSFHIYNRWNQLWNIQVKTTGEKMQLCIAGWTFKHQSILIAEQLGKTLRRKPQNSNWQDTIGLGLNWLNSVILTELGS